MRRTWMLLTVLVTLLAGASPAAAATFTVTGTSDTPPTQGCEGTLCPSIRAAILSAAIDAEPDTIVVPAGQYQLTTGQLLIDTPVTITGANARTTSVSGDPGAFRVLEVVQGVSAGVSRMTLRDGRAHTNGTFLAGGIVRNSGTLALDRVRVTGGTASSGGGIANTGGTLAVTNSLIDGNTASIGGADAGGLLNFGGGTMTVSDSTIANNSARQAGAFLSWGGPNTTSFQRVTIARNVANALGTGGIAASPGDTLQVGGSILAENTFAGTPSNCGSPILSQGSNVATGADCSLNGPGDRPDTDPVLADALADLGGDTDVLPVAVFSPAVNLMACTGTDQRGVPRPLGPRCDAGAVELDYEVRIDSGPTWTAGGSAVAFTFSSARAGATFECALDRPGGPVAEFAPCAGPSVTYGSLAAGVHTFRVRAIVNGEPIGEAPREFTVGPAVTVTSSHPSPTTDSSVNVAFTTSAGAVRVECRHVFPDGSDEVEAVCESPRGWRDLVEGTHRFELTAFDDAGNAGPRSTVTVDVDLSGPAPVEPAMPEPGTFVFASPEPGTVFECRLQGPTGDTGFVPCRSPQRYESLVPGEYTFTLVGIDGLGNRSVESRRAFAVAAPQPQPAVTPAPVITPGPTPAPTPQAGRTVVARAISGRVLVKRPGGTGFVELRGSDDIPVGSEVDAKGGRVRLTIEPGRGKRLQQAVFYAGIFRISQPGATLDLTLSEPLAACKKRASAAQSKAKTRKLWGDGKGKFRTKGRYSAATVRGTIWLVQDSCAGTLTRVRQGVVSVRDRRKTVLVRAGRSYLAKPRR